jgi:ribosomal protein S18 acetylase RimI-like enzyme
VEIEVRRVRPEEFEEAGRVTALAYQEFARPGDPDWELYLRRIADIGGRAAHTVVLVAVEDGRVLGSLTLELEDRVGAGRQDEAGEPLRPGEAHVRMLGLDPAARGRGIGRRLMDAALEEARAGGKTVMTLNTTRRMRAAQRMYESMGFVRGPDLVYDDGFRLLSYSLPLDRRVGRKHSS